MPKVTIPNTSLEFFFTDNGAPTAEKYTTYIIVHGHSYHAAVFQRLVPLASERGVRLICVNRREYPGSTPHTAQELRVYASGSHEERATLLHEEGVNLAICVDEIIQKYALSSVTLVSWSLGNTFTMAAMASILSFPVQSQLRIRTSVKRVILWDAPIEALGIPCPPNSYLPLYDTELAPEARGPVFSKWVQSYFNHNDLSSHDPKQLNYRTHDTSKRRTFEDLSPAEFQGMADHSASDRCDTVLTKPPFASIISAVVEQALFNPDIRSAWNHPGISYVVGEANPWNVLVAAWTIQERVKEFNGKTPISFTFVEGVNHFGMWDDPKKFLDVLIGCNKA
ncbi:hypothetical protein C8F04DRAFT_1041807 [Mycena alexandri]|uniref:AB hydrolase-1 domain-containing protein n=1 Tax=Mycena alexandri TaxID=1745969 RepID=A0AAD6SNQ3_9AGAR|nr:hypothetical protein C8F04DRAFT_1041807 [Mycena alexandri]